jgi:hypothetical protein
MSSRRDSINKQPTKNDHSINCQWLHMQLKKLPLIRYPFDLARLPDDGIYFFYEKGEVWGHGGAMPRIVRIGAHRSGNFRSRIKEHFVLDNGKLVFNSKHSAPKDRSIFRKNIGRALLKRQESDYLNVWEIDFIQKKNRQHKSRLRTVEIERRIERRISSILRKEFCFRYIAVENEMGGSGLESRLIGTVARCENCQSSPKWLGLYSPEDRIKSGKMWLVQHLKSEGISYKDKLRLRMFIDKQVKNR